MSSYREYDEKTLKKLHETELEIVDEIVRICNENNIDYFLVGGTLLGAVRHKGFIPWDDDIDLGMSRKDYDRFIKIAPKKLKEKYHLDCFEYNKDFYLPFAKVKKNGTIFDEEVAHHVEHHKGIYVDIFAFENIDKPNSIFLRMRAIIIKSIIDTTFYKHKMRELKKCRHPFLVSILSIFSKKRLMKIQQYLLKKNKNDNSKYVNALSGSYALKKEMLLREDVFPTKDFEFEGRTYKGMNNSHKYLSQLYGDYMKLPPKEKRVNHMPLHIDFGDKDEN